MTALSIPEADFWTEPRRTQLQVADRLLGGGFRGLLVDAPRTVDLDRHAQLPLVVARAATHAERRGPAFDERALLVAVRLPSNQTFVAPAFEPKEAPPRPPRTGPAPKGAAVRIEDVDVRERLPGLPWRPGEVLTRVLYRDQASNCARTTLSRGEPPSADPAVARFLDAQPAAYPQPVWPPAGARLTAAEGDPEVPPAPGLAVVVDRTALIPRGGDATCTLRLAGRVPFRARYLVRSGPTSTPDAEPEPDDRGRPLSQAEETSLRTAALREAQARALGLVWQDVLDPAATAVVPVTVVAVPADDAGAVVFPLQVPVHAPLDPARPPETLELRLAVDLLELPFGRALAGGTSFIYAFSDGLMAGPVVVAVVREEELRT